MDAELPIKLYNPQQQLRAPRIKEEEWQKYRHQLETMHASGYTRAQMRDWLLAKGFLPSLTLKQLNERMVTWGFRRYGPQGTISVSREDMVLPDMSLSPSPLSQRPGRMPNQSINQEATDNDDTTDTNTTPLPDTNLRLEDDNFIFGQFERHISVATDDRLEGSSDGQVGPAVRQNDEEFYRDIDRFVAERAQNQHDSWTPLHNHRIESSQAVDVDQIAASKPPPKSISNETRSSWSFYRVTGFPRGGASIMAESLNESIAEAEQVDSHSDADRVSNIGSDTRQRRLRFYDQNMGSH